MDSPGFLRDLAVALGAALAAGVVSHRLKQPVLVGYLLAGMAIGPHGLGLIAGEDAVSELAELGVILLMFALGVEFSLAQFRPVQGLVLRGGAAYVTFGTALVAGGLWLTGWAGGPALLVGGVLALSSTIIVMRILLDHRAIDAVHGKTMLGWLILQDLAVVPMLVLVPYLASGGGQAIAPLALALGKVALFLVLMGVLGTTLFPRILTRIAKTGHQELFFLAVIALCLGTAGASAAFGLSLALGAFLAGLVVSRSDEQRQVLADVLPLRDLFVTLFFVSIGMSVDPAFLAAHGPAIVLLALAIMAGKAALGTAIALVLRLSWRTALLIGLGLAQIGEFSFVLAQEGRAAGLISGDQLALLLAAALVTMGLTPVMMRLAPALAARAARALPAAAGADPDTPTEPGLDAHVVLVGYGLIGQRLGGALYDRGVPFLVVDLDPRRLDGLGDLGVPTLYGDGAMGEVLAHAGLPRARLLAVAVPDPAAARLVVELARRLNPALEIVLAAHPGDDPRTYLDAGAAEVIRPEVEAARVLVAACLARLDLPSDLAASLPDLTDASPEDKNPGGDPAR